MLSATSFVALSLVIWVVGRLFPGNAHGSNNSWVLPCCLAEYEISDSYLRFPRIENLSLHCLLTWNVAIKIWWQPAFLSLIKHSVFLFWWPKAVFLFFSSQLIVWLYLSCFGSVFPDMWYAFFIIWNVLVFRENFCDCCRHHYCLPSLWVFFLPLGDILYLFSVPVIFSLIYSCVLSPHFWVSLIMNYVPLYFVSFS